MKRPVPTSQAPRRLVDAAPDSPAGRLLRNASTVEPSSKELALIWAELARPPRQRRPQRRLWALSTLALAATAASLALLLPSPREDVPWTVSYASGEVLVGGKPVRAGEVWLVDRPLLVGEHGRAEIATQGVRGVLLAGASLERTGTRGAVLGSGELVAAVEADAPLSITVKAFGFEVAGAVFRLRATSSEVVLEVSEGSVEVAGPNAAVLIGPRECWTSADPTPRDCEGPSRSWLDAETSPALDPTDGQREEPDALEPKRSESEPTRVRKTRPSAREPVAGDATETERQRYDRALTLLRRGRYQDAAALLSELSTSTELGGLALYELARIEHRYLGDARAALATLDAHRTRFPTSPLRAEVDLFRIEALLASADIEEARRAASEFLDRHAGNERSHEVRFLRAEAARTAGDCAAALPDYELVARTGRGRWADDSMFLAGSCELSLGLPDEARRRFETYLRTFTSGRHRGEVEQALRR